MVDRTAATERGEIRAVIEGLWSAIGVRDAAAAAGAYAPDAVSFSLAPPLRSSPPDADSFTAWFDTWRGPIRIGARDVEISVGDDVAFCTSLNRMTGAGGDGEPVDLWYRVTFGLRRIDRRWRIVHEHESVPFYMDGSYRAAVDLVP